MHATLVGLGLIGGSIGKALKDDGWRVDFIDPAITEEEAVNALAADRKLATAQEIPPESLIVIGMPVDVSVQMLANMPALPNLTTSVSSVMAPLEHAAATKGWNFIPSHPLAGSHERGLVHSRHDMFSGRKWFVGATYQGTAVESMITACGASAVVVTSDEHDRALAFTSHLPQLLSTALGAVIAQNGIDVETFAGSGLRTFLRLAASQRSVWHSIIEANAENIDLALAQLAAAADQIVDGEDEDAFELANEIAKKLGA